MRKAPKKDTQVLLFLCSSEDDQKGRKKAQKKKEAAISISRGEGYNKTGRRKEKERSKGEFVRGERMKTPYAL